MPQERFLFPAMVLTSHTFNLDQILIRYLEFCEVEKNLSQSTIKMYDFYLRDFLSWAKNHLSKDSVVPSDLDAELVRKYRINLNRRISSKSQTEFKRSTQKTFLVALRAYLKYLVVEEKLDVISPEQILLGKSDARLPKVLDEDQLQRLFDVQNLNKKSGVRDRAILETLFRIACFGAG
jgi:integrase/recombinase XerD